MSVYANDALSYLPFFQFTKDGKLRNDESSVPRIVHLFILE